MSENESTSAPDSEAAPNPALQKLDWMIGTWDLHGREDGFPGEVRGRLEFEWMDGGFYVVQRVEIDYAGREVRETEYVGCQESTGKLRSYFFSNEGPGPFGDTISPDRNTISDRRSWAGGGYEATMTRTSSEA